MITLLRGLPFVAQLSGWQKPFPFAPPVGPPIAVTEGCATSTTGFNAIISAPLYSQLSGVMAGVLFTGIVLLISFRGGVGESEKDRQHALALMPPAVVALLVCSFLFAVEAGEESRLRASAEASASGTILGVCAVAMFQAIAWMFRAQDRDNRFLHVIGLGCLYLTTLFVLTQLAITFIDTMQAFCWTGLPVYLPWLLPLAGAAGILAIALAQKSGKQASPGALWSSTAMASTLVVGTIGFDIALYSETELWQPASGMPSWFYVWAPWLALTALGATLVLVLAAPPLKQDGSRSTISAEGRS